MDNYVYAAMWLIVGFLLVFRMGRENKVFYFVGGVFFLMAGWWLLEELTDLPMFDGAWGIAFRVIMAATLVLSAYVYFRERRKSLQAEADQEEELDPEEDLWEDSFAEDPVPEEEDSSEEAEQRRGEIDEC